jgi:hypothetical protein
MSKEKIVEYLEQAIRDGKDELRGLRGHLNLEELLSGSNGNEEKRYRSRVSDTYFTSNPATRYVGKKNKETVRDENGNDIHLSEAVFIDGLYYNKNNPNIVLCEVSKEYGLINRMFKAIKRIDFNNIQNVEHCFISKKIINTCIPFYSRSKGIEASVISTSAISNWNYKECLATGRLVDYDSKSIPIDMVKNYEQFKNPFGNVENIKDKLRLGIMSPSYLSTAGLKYKFGIELEVSRGYIPQWKANKLYNISCVRDGSVNPEDGGGCEYVTGVLTGDTGISHLQNLCLELSKRTKVNKTCGYHLHLGGFDFTKEFLINSYRLALILENEIFSTLPRSRRNNPYCKKLKKFNFKPAINNSVASKMYIEEDYNALFKYISYEKAYNPTFEYNKSKQHPLGAKCGYNKETPRYCWINYVPAMFNTRGNGSYSIEIRSHHGTTNFNKINNWLLFFMCFVAFSEKYPELITEGLTMNDVINKIMPLKYNSMVSYFDSRKQIFKDEESEESEYKTKNEEEPRKTIKELINN